MDTHQWLKLLALFLASSAIWRKAASKDENDDSLMISGSMKWLIAAENLRKLSSLFSSMAVK